MSWTAPATWVAGVAPTAAWLNAQIRDNLSHLYNLLAGQAVQSGTASVSLSAAASGYVDVTFPNAFATGTAPRVAATVDGQPNYYAVTSARTSAGVRLTVVQRDGATATTTVPVTWIAIGPAA